MLLISNFFKIGTRNKTLNGRVMSFVITYMMIKNNIYNNYIIPS